MNKLRSFTATELTNNIFGTDDYYDYEYEDDDCDEGYYHYEPESDDDIGILVSEDQKTAVETPKKPCFTIDVSENNMCSICMDECDDMVSVNNCHHKFCKDCLSGYINFKTSDASCLYHEVILINYEKMNVLKIDKLKTYGVPCPGHQCKHVMLINELKPLSTEQALSQFERFSKVHEDNLKRIEELRANMAIKREVECPKCSHKNQAVKGHRNRTKCSKCKTPFCYLCGLKHETVIDCEAYKKKRAYMMGIQDKLARELIAKLGYSRCGWCHSMAEKISGCNYIYCRCGKHFCYLCGVALSTEQHFSHFKESPYGNECKGVLDGVKKR